jgi:TRAP-type C4-dicarboxylate transport system substrate-binding protein
MDTAVHMEFFNSMGASAVPMPFSELFTGLQQGAVDAQENPYTNIYTQGYHEVQKYIIETEHIYDITPFMMSKITYDKLPEDLRKIVVDTAFELGPKEREDSLAGEQAFKQKIVDLGKNEIIVLTPEEKQAFIDVAKKLYVNHEARIGKDIIDAVLKAQEGYDL